MSSYVIRRLPPGLVAEAKARARELGTTVDRYLTQALTEFAEGTDRATYARQGGAARAASLTPEARTKIAREAAQARWRGPGDAGVGDEGGGNR